MDAFEAWVEHLFDRGADEFEPVPWYLGDSRPTEWTLHYEEGDTPVAQAERIGRLFSDAGALMRPYSDEQVGYGLDSLVFSAGGDIMVLGDGRVPSALRVAGLRSIVALFAEVFAPRLRAAVSEYAPVGQLSQPGLGHWHSAAPDEVSRIVGRWLQGHPQAPDKLRHYAVQASAGSVL
jgi:hypothetical protein